MKKFILVIDQGTTSTRAILYDKHAKIYESSQIEIQQIYPQASYVEHNPLELIDSVRTCVISLITKAKILFSQIACIGITNQRETVVLWDKKTGKPVHNAIVWQCRRTADICTKLSESGYADTIYKKTGLKLDPYFSATKIKWILENVPKAKQLLEENRLLIGTVDTYLMWNLSNGRIYATDYTNASRTMLFNIHTLEWDDELCELFGLNKSILPKVYPSGYNYGNVSSEIIGFQAPITAVAGDQQSSLFGQLCIENHALKVTYGTGCFLLMNTGKSAINSKNGLITTLTCTVNEPPKYALEGSVFMGGSVVQWLRDELGFIDEASQTENLSIEVSNTNGVTLVPAFVGLGAPYWNYKSRGMILGLSRDTNNKHLVRASLESIAYQVYDVIKAMMEDYPDISLENVKVDGGACKNNFLMQFQADILGKDIIRPNNIEVTSLGTCYLSGLTFGIFKSIEEIGKLPFKYETFKPKRSAEDIKKDIDRWHKAVRIALMYDCDE